LPDTVAVPTVVPPLVHVVGAEDCGPNTLKVIVPVAPLVAPDKVEAIELAPIATPVVPVTGADTLVLVALETTVVMLMPAPQPLLEAPLLASPP
jgi:hypothetical protein